MTSLTGVNVIQVSQDSLSSILRQSGTNSIVFSTTKVCASNEYKPKLTGPAILYKGLGMGPKTILALAGVYGTITFTSNAITTRYLTDQWGRRK